MEPPFDVQVELNTSGKSLLFLRDVLKQEGLKAQKKRLVDTFYNEVSHTYGLRPEGRIDYNQYGPDGKTLYGTPEDKKVSIAATRGKFRCNSLSCPPGQLDPRGQDTPGYLAPPPPPPTLGSLPPTPENLGNSIQNDTNFFL